MFEMLIGLFNDNSNLMVIKTYQIMSVTFILSNSHMILHTILKDFENASPRLNPLFIKP